MNRSYSILLLLIGVVFTSCMSDVKNKPYRSGDTVFCSDGSVGLYAKKDTVFVVTKFTKASDRYIVNYTPDSVLEKNKWTPADFGQDYVNKIGTKGNIKSIIKDKPMSFPLADLDKGVKYTFVVAHFVRNGNMVDYAGEESDWAFLYVRGAKKN